MPRAGRGTRRDGVAGVRPGETLYAEVGGDGAIYNQPTVDGDGGYNGGGTPTASIAAATGLTYNRAPLSGAVNPNATPLSDCHFTITPAPPGGSTLTCARQLGSGTTPVPVSAQLFGLSPSTTYTVRLSATDAQGQSSSPPITFRTLPPPPRISKPNKCGR